MPENGRKLGLLFSVSTSLAAPIVGGFLLGYFLDKWLHTGPWLLLTFGLLGTAGGFIGMLRVVEAINREKDDE